MKVKEVLVAMQKAADAGFEDLEVIAVDNSSYMAHSINTDGKAKTTGNEDHGILGQLPNFTYIPIYI